MDEKYYLALFNQDTWFEFVDKGASVYGTSMFQKKHIEATKPGDFLICYVIKLSRFVGLLEITSESYIDESRIWKKEIYPLRVKVHPIHILKEKEGIHISEVKEDLNIFKNSKSPNS